MQLNKEVRKITGPSELNIFDFLMIFMKRFLSLLLILSVIALPTKLLSQKFVDEDYPEYNPTKFKLVVAGGAAFYAGTLIGLHTIWYADKHRTNFHWFDDNTGWMKVDKFGHMYTSYIFGKAGIRALRWSGVDRKKAIWFGGTYGFLFLSSVEFLDGHYAEWGASPGDIAFNALGSAFLISQELAIGRQAVAMKFSYNPTPLAELRPDVLGEGSIERIIKDYNGQTYWFSANYRTIFRNHTFMPKWLNFAGGYSAYGMLGGDANPDYLPKTERYGRYLVSLDIDFDQIKTKSKFVNSVFFFLNLIKIPLPTVEFNDKGETIFHPVYF